MRSQEAPLTLFDLAGTPDEAYRLAARLSLIEPHARRARRCQVVLLGAPLTPALYCGRLLLTPGTVLGLDSDVSHMAYLRGRLGHELGAAADALRNWEGRGYSVKAEQLDAIREATLMVAGAVDERAAVATARRPLFGLTPGRRLEAAQATLDEAHLYLGRALASAPLQEVPWPPTGFLGWDERSVTSSRSMI
ncbi:hypothetical protein [Deinococcus ficus]|uniref:Uncharacterized protein n=1 Tax=Deinococcus ficus TaxID=317577 RepID=A0A221STC0_9DEIO|nr:hypothetical protein [Deinococcus ficus]ASN79881.1 hypothetical protein DFI_01650 [Deinococcus ficus]